MIIKTFEQAVRKFAKETAIVTDNGRWIYEEVNKQANNLARAVLETGELPVENGQPQVVGLLFEHSAAMVISVLGTLKADKAYLPLDITYPENRLAYMLEDSGAGLVLTNNNNISLAERLAALVSKKINIINIDTVDMEDCAGYRDIPREPSGQRLAYILYTSGSTGRPKGVMQNRENVCYYIRNWTDRFSITHNDRMTLFTAFSHDGAGQDMFGALHNGAVLYPYSILNRPNISGLIRWLKEEQITIYHSVPTIYRYFVNTLEDRNVQPGSFPHLRFILLGGEQVRDHDIRMFRQFFPGVIFANVYGQTESSVSTVWTVRHDEPVNKMLIGEPLDNTRILIVDDEGEIVEDMGMGEIVVVCKHISPGYWNNEEAGKGKFIHDPELGYLYRTGDLGRLMADGSIECMGRKDAQVKIRGFRIETGEIETRLLQHPAVKEVVVMVRQDEESSDYICAYFTTAPSAGEQELTVSQLRSYLSGEIPEYMVPSHFVRLDKIPVTPNGKVDRKSLPEPAHTRPQLEANYVAPESPIERQISEAWKDVLNLDKVGIDDNFFDLGGTSFDIIKIMGRLYEVFKKDIPVVSIFRYPTVRSFVRYLSGEEAGTIELRDRVTGKDKEGKDGKTHEPIAVVGMSCRFPGSKNLDEFWENLKNGVESISLFTDDELASEGIGPLFLDNPNYVKSKGIIGDVDQFDAAFFNYSPAEAQVMDPQLRLLHECSWEALEHAGYASESFPGLIGLYAGNANNSYWLTLIHMNRISAVDTGFLINNYSTIVSYKLNLRGPSFVVQSACSTSLVAVHLACRGLMDRECDMALAGGVSISFPEKNGYIYQEGMILSPDGHCRTFDANASGTVFGNGAGIVVLKRLTDAEADGDTIHAVILGTGVNNDGKRKVGLSSPSVDGQAEVIANVYHQSCIAPETVGYLEAHGTATPLGDPVELEALKLAFNTDKRAFCKIGSVKSNVGHLNIAAGIAGFIKAVLTLENKMIPPSLHFETPNPKIDFQNSPFVVNTGLTEWKREQFPLRAAVSSFGIGGTNAHVLLEEAPGEKPSAADSRPLKMLLLSAVSRDALRQASENLGNFLAQNPRVNLADVAYTLQVGRKTNKLKKMLLCSTAGEAVEHLRSTEEPLTPETGKVHISATDEDTRPIVFMFSGQGAQYVDMGLELYRTEPIFRAEMDRCFALLAPLMDDDLKEILFRSDKPYRSYKTYESNEGKINLTGITQPLLFIFEYSLARLLTVWGFTPYAMIGHSIGEYVAACLAGVFSLEDALKLVAARGRLMQSMPGGSMLSVPLPEEKVIPLLTGELSLAAVNTLDGCVVSGPPSAVDSLERELIAGGLNCRRLHTSHAFHSAVMDPILDEFEKIAAGVKRNHPTIPYISNVTGNWITVEEAVDPAYWSRHLRSTVRFADGLSRLFTLLRDSDALFLEVGPGRTLSTFVWQHRDRKPGHASLNLIRHPKETVSDSHYLLSRIGRLWLEGKKVDWKGFYSGERRHRVPLPTYPFQKQSYWLKGDPYKLGTQVSPSSREYPAGKSPDIADWFYVPSWKTSAPPPRRDRKPATVETSDWMLFIEEDKSGTSLGHRLRKELTDAGHHVVSVQGADRFSRVGENEYTVNPAEEDDYRTLLAHCIEKGKIPRQIVHLWNLSGVSGNRNHRELAFYSLLYLARAVGMENTKENIRLTVVTDRMQPVTGEEIVEPQKATINGILQVIPREYSNLECRSIDIDTTGLLPGIDRLVNELLSGDQEFIAFRDRYRWVRSFEPMPLEKPTDPVPGLKEGGVYLVTGGLGGIGLVLAEYLAKTLKSKLILINRTPLSDSTSVNKQKIRDMEACGAEVLVMGADVSDRLQMREVVDRVQERFGKIDGVIHAAGIADGGLIRLRAKELSERVFAPKIDGTLILDDLLKDSPPDFFILCSSVSAVTGTLGQAAYSAANAFLDSFAYYKSATNKTLTVSIGWDAWQEVGMAVEAVKQFARSTKSGASAVTDVDYPFFNRCEIMGSHQAVYVSYLQSRKCWFLDEHRVMGKAALPGTAYLEMARAAVEHYLKNGAIELSEFYTLTPFMVDGDDEKELRIVINRDRTGGGCSFSFIGRVGSTEDAWVEIARGKAAPLESTGKEPKRFDLKAVEAVCSKREIRFYVEEYNQEQGAMKFGPRWNNLREVKIGTGQALAFLELPEEYAEEAGTYKLHPALLDVGNVVLKRHEEHEGTYVPAFYKRLSMKGSVPSKVYFHVRGMNGNCPGAETLQYDISVMDEEGIEWVDIEAYTLRKVNPGDRAARQFNRRGEDAPLPLSSFVTGNEEGRASVSHLLKDAISPAEGIDVFLRVLGEAGLPQVIVSAIPLEPRLKKGTAITVERENERPGELDRSAPKLARPELSTDYAAPVTETEKALAPIWEELLGIREVGIHDHFFELGGDSLKAVNFGARIHKALNTEVPVSEFFNKPTIKELAQYIDGISEKSRFHAIRPAEEKEYYVLSSAQKRMFILQQLERDSLGYNLPSVFQVDGKPDKRKFEKAFAQLVDRHESFRTSFRVIDGKPAQQVHPAGEVAAAVEYYDTADYSDSPESSILSGFVRPFDLSCPPLIRIGLVRLAEARFLFLIDAHHIIFDGMSNLIFFKEFMEIYGGKSLVPAQLQYKDYSEWRNLRENVIARQAQEKYWIDLFSQKIPILNLPIDFERPAAQSFEGKRLTFTFDREKTGTLKTMATKGGQTLYMLLLAVINVLLMKLSGQEDIVVGTPVAGRKHTDLQQVIGVFINTLALRSFPSREKTFESFLGEVKTSTLKAFENQDCQFEELLDKVDVRRDAGRNPLFDVMFRMQNFELSDGRAMAIEIDGLKLTEYDHDPQKSMLDLSFTAVELNKRLVFFVEFCTKLFKVETIRRMIDYFGTIVNIVLENPRIPLSGIEIVTGEERQRLLFEFNNTDVDFPREKNIHRLFEERAAMMGHEIAVTGNFYPTLGYRELNRQADVLARRLRAKGVRAGTIAAVLLKRTPAVLVGLLGILKTGAAYLPLDPEYPEARIKYILEKSGARYIVTQGDLNTDSFFHGFEGEIVDIGDNIDDNTVYIGTGSDENPIDSRDLHYVDHPAYVIYTSGSTGNPKGVLVTHRNAVNFIEGMAAIIDFSPRKTILALTTISFDIFFLETLLPVTRGLKVVVADEEQQRDPTQLKSLIFDSRVDMLQVTPSRLQLMLDPRAGGNVPACVGELLVGGEAFPTHLFNVLRENFRGRIYNVYGPTETTIWSTVKDLTGIRPEEMTIGRPIANTRVYIVDPGFHLQPVGVAGELLIGGEGVAAGYLNNVELTAEKFTRFSIFDESEKTYSTVYRTGDLARWLPDGDIEFMGRLDHQVKIRGFRIELEEIEEQLLKHENIKEAVVIANTGRNDEKYLCAYFVPRKGGGNGGNGFNTADLRSRLSAKLPPYMIPSYFVQLDAVPLTPNGKIDRKALPEPDASRSSSGATYIAPRNGNEMIIAQLWKEILQMDDVGINDNFFDLGGNSMNAIQLNWKLKETFGKEIPVALMFRNLSISFLDSYLSRETDMPEAEKEIDRTEALEKAQKTFKNTISKFAGNRRSL